MDKNINIFEESHASDILTRLDQFRKNGQYCDFTIKCGSENIPVHKCLIAASSEYFDAMLSHDTKERQKAEVEIKDVDSESVAKCIDFVYTGKGRLSDRKLTELIHVARLLQFQKFCNHIVAFMENNLDVNSFFSLREVANVYGFQNLSKACDEFAVDNFHVIMKMEEFKDLEPDYLGSLLFSKELNLLDDVKCKALMIWVDNDSKRTASLFTLINRLDITRVRISYRKFLLDTPVIFNSTECLQYIMNSIPEGIDVKAADYAGDCNPGIIIANRNSGYLERFDLEKKSWTVMHALRDHTGSHDPSMICVDQYLYMFNMERRMLRLCFTNLEATWEVLSNLPPKGLRYCNGPITSFNGMLYVSNFTYETRQIWQYNIAEDQWSELPPKKIETVRSSMVVAYGKLLVIGGLEVIDEGTWWYESHSDVECYDPTSLTWLSDLSNLNEKRVLASSCTHKDVVYVFGGWNERLNIDLRSVEILYSENSPWVILELNKLSITQFLSYSVNGKILLVGDGPTSDNHPNGYESVLVFDPKSKAIVSEFPLTATKNDFISFVLSAVVNM